MVEFLKSYGIWIVLGLFLLLMLRGHAHRGGGYRVVTQHNQEEPEKKEGQQESGTHSSGCH